MKKWLIIGSLLVAVCIGGFWLLRRNPGNLVYQGRTATQWGNQLSSTNQQARTEAGRAFQAMGTRALPELLHLLEMRDPFWRRYLLRNAGKLPTRLRAFILPRVQPTELYRTREAAAWCLGKLGPQAHPAVPALVAAVRDDEGRVRWEAAEALGHIGGTSAVPGLINALQASEPATRQAAIFALGQIGPDAREAVPALARALNDRGAWSMAIYGLAHMGTSAAPVTVDLCLKGDANMRAATARVLGGLLQNVWPNPEPEIMPPDPAAVSPYDPLMLRRMLEALSTALNDPVTNVRLEAAQSLFLARGVAAPAVPDLTRALKDQSPAVRQLAARALGGIGPAAKSGVPELTRLAAEDEKGVRTAAKEALRRIAE